MCGVFLMGGWEVCSIRYREERYVEVTNSPYLYLCCETFCSLEYGGYKAYFWDASSLSFNLARIDL